MTFQESDFEALRAMCRADHLRRIKEHARVPTSQACYCGATDLDGDPACLALGRLWKAYRGSKLEVSLPTAVFDWNAMHVRVEGRKYVLVEDWTTEVYDGDFCIGKLEPRCGFGVARLVDGTPAQRAQWQSDVDAMIRTLAASCAMTDGWSERQDATAYEGEAHGFRVSLLRTSVRPGWRWHVYAPGDACVGRGVLDHVDRDVALRTVQAIAWGFGQARRGC